jgi:hypothetical protein
MISKEPPMPNKSLVLVLGAGSSEEVDLPVGAELKRQIAERLDIRFQDYARQPGSGDDKLLQAFRLASVRSDGSQGDINQLLDVSRLIRDAMPQAISIDNFIDSHRNDERIAFCGKLAIARCILEAEARSKLLVDRSNIYNKLDFGAIENTWFTHSSNCSPRIARKKIYLHDLKRLLSLASTTTVASNTTCILRSRIITAYWQPKRLACLPS